MAKKKKLIRITDPQLRKSMKSVANRILAVERRMDRFQSTRTGIPIGVLRNYDGRKLGGKKSWLDR